MSNMTETIAKTGEQDRQVGQWVRRFYPSTENTGDATCFIEEITRGDLPNRVVLSVVDPGVAAGMVRGHNQRPAELCPECGTAVVRSDAAALDAKDTT